MSDISIFIKELILLRQVGVEPTTYCLEGSCSIQLSYWRMIPHIHAGSYDTLPQNEQKVKRYIEDSSSQRGDVVCFS